MLEFLNFSPKGGEGLPMLRWIKKILVEIWRVSDDKIIEPNYILVHSYGLRNPKELPYASRKVMEEAGKFALRFPKAEILMASSSYFWSGCVVQENNLKLAIPKGFGISKKRIVLLGGVKNTIEEIKKARAFVGEKDSVILSIADDIHARSVRSMFAKIFPEAKIIIHSVAGDWNDLESPLFFGRSNWRWLAANVARHVGYLLIGERIASLHHPLRKK